MQIHVNGRQMEVVKDSTIGDLLNRFNIQEKLVVVEQNKQIINKVVYNQTTLTDGDVIEIVHFVGGG
ncbi:sulfur carrier protein ThiS [Virgibacillus salexigens]|uniref:Thiamine biosynthesis protein ThiS n=1 Tax=Virgibacillus massiliensis TaxID=1462526 RepID=A0A024Q9L4_9BACI|nr:sulfur carrier protein ThiS [Virgibacillus massiliensis]MYL40574.1 sulfur carrier protein ThiS [Virgibacillus massiliensis]CDQ38631.1 Thiamine biosynthesis protein ThiS [Virgibacillus massiliensis]